MTARLYPHLRGHLFQFDPRPTPAYGDAVGAQLFLAAVVLEVLRVVAFRWLNPPIPIWLMLPVLLAVALLAERSPSGGASSEEST